MNIIDDFSFWIIMFNYWLSLAQYQAPSENQTH